MADSLHEVVSGARQDRSRVKTSSVSGVIQSLKFVRRKAQVDSLITVLNSPWSPGTSWVQHSLGRDEKHCHCPGQRRYNGSDGSAVDQHQNMKFTSLVASSSWFGQASASQTLTAHVSRRCFETDMSYGESTGEPKSPDQHISRSLEHEGKRLQTACRCHFTLPPTCHMIQRQPPRSLTLPNQSMSSCGPDRAGFSDSSREL